MISSVTFTPALAAASAITLHSSSTRQLTKVDGLVGTPNVRGNQQVLPGRDGVSDNSKYLDARSIVLEGELWGATGGAALEDLSLIASAFQTTLLSPGVLTVTYENGTVRWTSVKLAGAIDSSVEGASRLVSYQVQLVAPDPRWYSTTLKTSALAISASVVTTSSSATVVNAGTAPSFPLFTWTGGTGTGRLLDRVTVNVPSAYATVSPQGSAIVLDDSGTATPLVSGKYVDTGSRTTTLSDLSAVTEWPVFYPGSSIWNWSIQLSGGSGGSTTCTATWYDAWW